MSNREERGSSRHTGREDSHLNSDVIHLAQQSCCGIGREAEWAWPTQTSNCSFCWCGDETRTADVKNIEHLEERCRQRERQLQQVCLEEKQGEGLVEEVFSTDVF